MEAYIGTRSPSMVEIRPIRSTIMDQHPHELPIPDPSANNEHAREILRVWAAGGRPQISIDTTVWEDPVSWGIMLVDLAKHLANAYEQAGRMNHAMVLSRIKQNFDAKWTKR